MLIDNEIMLENMPKYYYDQLRNSQVLLHKVQSKIYELKDLELNAMKRYSLDTGQTRTTVDRDYANNIKALSELEAKYKDDVEYYAQRCGLDGGAVRVVPWV